MTFKINQEFNVPCDNNFDHSIAPEHFLFLKMTILYSVQFLAHRDEIVGVYVIYPWRQRLDLVKVFGTCI